MTIHVTCECGRQLLAPDDCAGRQALCPVCQRSMALPDSETAIPPGPLLPAMPSLEVGITDVPPPETPAINPVISQSARMSMTFGIASLAVPLILGILAWTFGSPLLALVAAFAPILLGTLAAILGIRGLRAIDRDPQALCGNGMARAGLALGGVTAALVLAVHILLPSVSKARAAAARIHSVSRLKQIGLACHTYHDAYGHFPAEGVAANLPDQSKLSWRVQILTHFCENNLYQEFHHDEPWDSPHNIKLLPRMPLFYLDPRFQTKADQEKGLTYYRGFVGPGGVFGASPPADRLEMMNKNGAPNTMMVVEAGEPVPWTKPEGPDFDENSPLGGPERAKFFAALFADGHVQTLPQNFDRKMIRKMINWENMEPVQLP